MSRTRAHRNPKRRGRARSGALPKDLYAYTEVRPLPRIGHPPKLEGASKNIIFSGGL